MYGKFLVLVLLLTSYLLNVVIADYGADQLKSYKNVTDILSIPLLTSSNGAPVEFHDADSSLNSNIIRNRYLMESLTHLVRERIPERVVHGKGAGAFGYFEVTNNLSHICKAKLFGPVGDKTPIAVRFSFVFSHVGEIDTKQGSRGFAIKFYTEEGNFDVVGLSDIVFPINDPIHFHTFVHTSFKNPVNNLINNDMLWDFITAHPKSLFAFLRLFSEIGIPASYQNMPGFSVHTYEFVNDEGKHSFARFHIIPDAGLKYLNASETASVSARDSEYYTRLLYNDIAGGQYPSWTVKLQVISLEDAMNGNFSVFDTTRELYVDDFPLQEFGRIILNRNPDNFFRQVEQVAFCPSNLVPGILGAPDKLFEARVFIYRDAQNHRLGANFDKIDVNYPYRSKVATYNRDGVPPVRDNGMDGPNYYPNSFNGPRPYVEGVKSKILSITQKRSPKYDQADKFYKDLRTEEKDRVIAVVVSTLSTVTDNLRDKAFNLFKNINTEFAKSVEKCVAILRSN